MHVCTRAQRECICHVAVQSFDNRRKRDVVRGRVGTTRIYERRPRGSNTPDHPSGEPANSARPRQTERTIWFVRESCGARQAGFFREPPSGRLSAAVTAAPDVFLSASQTRAP